MANSHFPWSSLIIEWLPVGLVFVIGCILEVGEPYERYIHQEELYGYSYPLKPNTVSSSAVFAMVTVVPSGIILFLWSFHRDKREMSRALLGLWTSLTLTFLITNVVKLMIGRPRPNFVARCWPDGKVVGIPGVPQCTGDPHSAKEGRKSFPSGHSSLSFSGMGFLSFYLIGRLRPWGEPTRAPWRFFVAVSPLLLAGWVALTRISDYWHHPTDVMAGTTLGLVISYLSFSQHSGVLSGRGGNGAFRTLSAPPELVPLGSGRGSSNGDDVDRTLPV